jgi:hypothetical protein
LTGKVFWLLFDVWHLTRCLIVVNSAGFGIKGGRGGFSRSDRTTGAHIPLFYPKNIEKLPFLAPFFDHSTGYSCHSRREYDRSFKMDEIQIDFVFCFIKLNLF